MLNLPNGIVLRPTETCCQRSAGRTFVGLSVLVLGLASPFASCRQHCSRGRRDRLGRGCLVSGSTFGGRPSGNSNTRGAPDALPSPVGVVAEEAVRKRYLNGYVGRYFSQGAQNPISYVNLDS